MFGLAGHLQTLARADVAELGGLWISLMNMLVRSLAAMTQTAPTPPKRAGSSSGATSAATSPIHSYRRRTSPTRCTSRAAPCTPP